MTILQKSKFTPQLVRTFAERKHHQTLLVGVLNLRKRRLESMQFLLGTATVSVRDQAPLYPGNIRFEGGWSFEDFVQSLNERVFFWPGSLNGPIGYGQRHFARYASEDPAILRISTADLYKANRGVSPLYCPYNSGSPRWSWGVASLRGPKTFVSCTEADYGPSRVVEVTFLEKVKLPALVEIGDINGRVWRSL
jgi:hypothetical protein